MNKFLHAPLQALKSAAREGDTARMDAIRQGFEGLSERSATQVEATKDPQVEAPPEAAVEQSAIEEAESVSSLRSRRS